jgi:hypothetical protein
MSMRIVGWASVILGICFVVLGLTQMSVSKDIAAALTTDGRAWSMPVSKEVFFARSKIWGGVVISVGALTALGGVGMALRRRWGFHAAATAAVVMLVFPRMTQILLAKEYAFDSLSLVDFSVAALAGLSASLAWMFRPK